MLVAAVEELVERLEALADPELERLRKRAEAALERAKAAELAESGKGHLRLRALLGVAAACVVVLGLWTGRTLLIE